MTATTTRARTTKATTSTTSVFTALGKSLGGQMKAITALDTESAHAAYTKASEAKQAVMKNEFVVAYVAAYLGVSHGVAETIVGQTRKEREEADPARERAVNGANKMFAYHVARKGGKAAGAKAKVRVPSVFRDSAEKFVKANFGDFDKANIRQAVKLLNAIAAKM